MMNEMIPKIETTSELAFAQLAPEVWNELSKLQRTGWVQRGVENPETVAEHTMALKRLGKILGEFSETERKELLDMLEVHDWPEAVHGDEVILHNGDDSVYASLKSTKFEKEQNALRPICEKMGSVGKTIFNLWMRFETSDDAVANFHRIIVAGRSPLCRGGSSGRPRRRRRGPTPRRGGASPSRWRRRGRRSRRWSRAFGRRRRRDRN